MITLTQLDEALRAAGIPIEGVRDRGGVIEVDYSPGATAEQQQVGAAIVTGWDDAAEGKRAKRRAAKASLAGVDDPTQIASRNALRVIYQSIVETRQALNPLLVAAGQPPLPIRNWKQALAAVRQQIDAEIDPEG